MHIVNCASIRLITYHKFQSLYVKLFLEWLLVFWVKSSILVYRIISVRKGHLLIFFWFSTYIQSNCLYNKYAKYSVEISRTTSTYMSSSFAQSHQRTNFTVNFLRLSQYKKFLKSSAWCFYEMLINIWYILYVFLRNDWWASCRDIMLGIPGPQNTWWLLVLLDVDNTVICCQFFMLRLLCCKIWNDRNRKFVDS